MTAGKRHTVLWKKTLCHWRRKTFPCQSVHQSCCRHCLLGYSIQWHPCCRSQILNMTKEKSKVGKRDLQVHWMLRCISLDRHLPAFCIGWIGLPEPLGFPLKAPRPPRSPRIEPRPPKLLLPFMRLSRPSWNPFANPLLRPLSHPPGESSSKTKITLIYPDELKMSLLELELRFLHWWGWGLKRKAICKAGNRLSHWDPRFSATGLDETHIKNDRDRIFPTTKSEVILVSSTLKVVNWLQTWTRPN